MKIKDVKLITRLEDAKSGKVFRYKDTLYMRTDSYIDGSNSVQLDNGKLHYLDSDEIIIVVDAELIVK